MMHIFYKEMMHIKEDDQKWKLEILGHKQDKMQLNNTYDYIATGGDHMGTSKVKIAIFRLFKWT
jgi:hypothetical protein